MPDLAANRRSLRIIAWALFIGAALLAIWGATLASLAGFLVFVVVSILANVSGALRTWARTEESIDVLPFSSKQLELNERNDSAK